jgi:hypothetical protein
MREYVARYPGSHPDGVCGDAAQFRRFCKSLKDQSKLKPAFDHIFVFLRNFLSPPFLVEKISAQKIVDNQSTTCHYGKYDR